MNLRTALANVGVIVLVGAGVAGCSSSKSSSTTTAAAATTAPGTTGAPTTAAPTTAAPTTAAPTTAPATTATTAAPTTAAVTTAPPATAAPTSVAPGPLAGIAGTYTGTWTNTTFGSTGPATFAITTDPQAQPGTQITFAVTLGGQVFGAAAPAPETFEGPISADGVSVTGTSANFGTLVWTITNAGALSVTGAQVPGGRVMQFTATGTIAGGKIDINYSVDLVGGQKAQGTLQATRA